MQEKKAKAAASLILYNITWRVRRLLSSVWIQARRVNSVIKIWAALANNTGASALIICNRRRPSLSITSKSFKPVCPSSHVLPMGYGSRTREQEGGCLKRFQGKINPWQSRDKAGSTQRKGRGRKVLYLAPPMDFLSLIKAFQRN